MLGLETPFNRGGKDRPQSRGTLIQVNGGSFPFGLSTREGRVVHSSPYSVGAFPVLAMTKERIHLKPELCCAARVEGRSSLARLGLIVHLTAPIIHSGFNAPVTLEMLNHGPFYLQLNPGKTRICQLVIERLESAPFGEIRTEFQNQTSPAG